MNRAAIIFCDASVRVLSERASAGYVVMSGRSMLVGHRPIDGVLDSNEAEAIAAEMAYDACIDAFERTRRIEFVVDSQSVVEAMNQERKVKRVHERIEGLLRKAKLSGVDLRARWIKGHRDSRPFHHGNSMADALADIGRVSPARQEVLRLDWDWRRSMHRFDDRLCRSRLPTWFTYEEASQHLSVPAKTVVDLVRHGHLEDHGYRVSKGSVMRVRNWMMQQGLLDQGVGAVA